MSTGEIGKKEFDIIFFHGDTCYLDELNGRGCSHLAVGFGNGYTNGEMTEHIMAYFYPSKIRTRQHVVRKDGSEKEINNSFSPERFDRYIQRHHIALMPKRDLKEVKEEISRRTTLPRFTE